jgi:hypothetical protein
MNSYLQFVARLKLKQEYGDKMMYKNAKELFKI